MVGLLCLLCVSVWLCAFPSLYFLLNLFLLDRPLNICVGFSLQKPPSKYGEGPTKRFPFNMWRNHFRLVLKDLSSLTV